MTKMLNMYEDAMVGQMGNIINTYIYIYITCIACIHFYTIAFDSSKNLGHNIDISGFTILLAQRTVNPICGSIMLGVKLGQFLKT